MAERERRILPVTIETRDGNLVGFEARTLSGWYDHAKRRVGVTVKVAATCFALGIGVGAFLTNKYYELRGSAKPTSQNQTNSVREPMQNSSLGDTHFNQLPAPIHQLPETKPQQPAPTTWRVWPNPVPRQSYQRIQDTPIPSHIEIQEPRIQQPTSSKSSPPRIRFPTTPSIDIMDLPQPSERRKNPGRRRSY